MTATITIMIQLPNDITTEDIDQLKEYAGESIDGALEMAGIDGHVIKTTVETPK